MNIDDIKLESSGGIVTTLRDRRDITDDVPFESRNIIFKCDQCGAEFETKAQRWEHIMKEHPVERPALFLDGIKQDSKSLITISRVIDSENIEIQRMDYGYLDSIRFKTESALKNELSIINDGIHKVSLTKHKDNDTSEKATYTFDFKIPNKTELETVDKIFFQEINRSKLHLDVINKFQSRVKKYKTTELYVDALSNYLYGILAKDQSGGTSLPYKEFIEKYKKALALLVNFDTGLAINICNIINFNFNWFELLDDNSPISLAIKILRDPLHKKIERHKIDNQIIRKSNNKELEQKIPVDNATEKIFKWTIMPPEERMKKIYDLEYFILSNNQHYSDRTKTKILIIEMANNNSDIEWIDKFKKYYRELSQDRACRAWINEK